MTAVGSLTIVFAKGVSPKAAKHLVDEIAGDVVSYEAIDAVKCDLAKFDEPELDAFWDEALRA